jgi:hypothetical protein
MIGSGATTSSTPYARECSRGSSAINALRPLAALAICLVLAACAPHRRPPQPHPSPPVAVSAVLDLVPLDLSPDGEARLVVRLRYADADGKRAHIPPGGHVDVFADRGEVQWQPRARYGDPAAIVRLTEAGPLKVRVTSDAPRVPQRLTAATNTRAWRLPPVTARPLGPRVVVLGWFPRVHSGVVSITRMAQNGTRVAFEISAPASSFRDSTVMPGAQYTYAVRRPGANRVIVGVGVPRELPASTADVMRGKAMWLSFDDVGAWKVDAMLDRAQRAGLHTIELRLCYGEYRYFTPARRAVIDRFIDGATLRGIAIVAWTVPRAVSFEDLAANVAAAAYRTAAGNGPQGLAVDLERGADFLGTGELGREALATYLARLREAVGPRVLLVATVEDPAIEQLTDQDVPYATIAADADVLQPMMYWRVRRTGASLAGMQAQLAASYARLAQLVGDRIPIDIGGQTANLDNRIGPPPPEEVSGSLVVAQQLGALGEAFFDWDATTTAQWAAIGSTPWSATAAVRGPSLAEGVPQAHAGSMSRVEVGLTWRQIRL